MIPSSPKDHVSNDSTFCESVILDDLDSYWDELNDRLSVSRMVSDSVVRGIVNAVVEEATEKVATKEAEMAVLHEKLQSYEASAAADQTSTALTMTSSSSSTISELHKSFLGSSEACKYADNEKQLWVLIEEQIQGLKEDLQYMKLHTGDANARCCSIFSGGNTRNKLLEIDQRVDALECLLVAGFEKMGDIICSKKVLLSAHKWEHELQREVTNIVIQDYIRSLQDEYETMLYKQKTFTKILEKNWQEKFVDLRKMRDKLHAISEEAGSHETFEEWTVSKRKDHFTGKVLGNHNFPSQTDEDETIAIEEAVDSGEEMLDIADLPQLKHMSREELLAYCKTEMTKMRRRHESALHEKTEEIFKLKREFLKEKGSLHFRKDKEYEYIRNAVSEFILKLDQVLVENNLSPSIEDEIICSFKQRIDSLFRDNVRLQGLLMKNTKELEYLSSQVSDAANQMSFHSSLETTYLNKIKKLEHDYGSVILEASMKSESYVSMLNELMYEHKYQMEDMEIRRECTQEISSIIFRGTLNDAMSSMNHALSKYHMENTSLKAYLFKMEQEVVAKMEENQKLEKDMSTITALIEQKERLASKSEFTLIEQQQQLSQVHQELHMLREQLDKQQVQTLELKMETHSTKNTLNEALQKIHLYELKMGELNRKLQNASDALDKANKQKDTFQSIIEDKEKTLSSSFQRDKEQIKQLKSMKASMTELSKAFSNLEYRLTDSTTKNDTRLRMLNRQLNSLVQQASQQENKCLWYKQMLELRCSNLQKAEAEVDLLGDEVDALLGLLGRVYLALDHYSPVLQHYPGVMEILKLVHRELTEKTVKLC